MKNIRFLGSFPSENACPATNLPEVAFVGRSNVGKSSLINYLTGRKNLAKTSGTPGKTQMINMFEVDNTWILVDLPGYGYARTSKKARERFEKMINDYLRNRQNLLVVLQLIDLRIPPQESDIERINWMGEHAVPFCIVFTKTEKITPDHLEKRVGVFRDTMLEYWSSLPPTFATSSTAKTGGENLLAYLEEIINN